MVRASMNGGWCNFGGTMSYEASIWDCCISERQNLLLHHIASVVIWMGRVTNRWQVSSNYTTYILVSSSCNIPTNNIWCDWSHQLHHAGLHEILIPTASAKCITKCADLTSMYSSDSSDLGTDDMHDTAFVQSPTAIKIPKPGSSCLNRIMRQMEDSGVWYLYLFSVLN